MSILLTTEGLICGYHGKAVTKPITLHVPSGRALALIGPNGSGKSTLLKTLAGELKPLGGILDMDPVEGARPQNRRPAQVAQRIAVVPQDESYAFKFSVRQIVGMGRLCRSSGFFELAEDERAVEDALREADCLELAERSILEISGGERQRVMLARALAQETPLLILDEPTSHLDVSHVAEFVRLVRKLKEAGKGIILAVHDLNVALALADEILLLAKGEPRFQGSPEALANGNEAATVYGVRFARVEQEGCVILAALLP